MERGRFYQQFGERSGSGKSFNLDRPVDLVGNIRGLIEQEKASHSRSWVERFFNAPMWLRRQLDSQFHEKEASKIAPRELAGLALDLRTAWDVVAYNAYPKEEDLRDSINSDLRDYMSLFNTNTVTLTDPLAVQFLDAMAEAADIPHKPGQTTFDLNPFKYPDSY